MCRRDASADGTFVCAVATTGIYCRPSCPARLPRRENVDFYAEPAAARAAGFRACLRCQPDGESPAARRAGAVAAACRLIASAIADGDEVPDLAGLAAAAGHAPSHFHRLFRSHTGLTPRQYAAGLRDARAKAALADGGSVTEAIQAGGYGSTSRFYEGAAANLGMTPSAWRAGGQGARIRFAVGQCSLGAIMVAATERGVCAIELGDSAEALLHSLQDRFPAAELVGGDASFDALVAQVIAFAEAPCGTFTLPLDVLGTAFQRRVWEALTRIPPGRTATYTQIAETIGAPRAVRAVAAACAANPVALAVPCHRVVRTDGALAGYRWGLARKRALIDREAGA